MKHRLLFDAGKRWLDRVEHWRAPGETIRASEFGVDVLGDRAARHLVVNHHYSGTFPAARLNVGLFRRTGVAPSRLVGVATFSVPMQQQAIPAHTGFTAAAGVELGRFVCLPEVAYNGESWFLARAFAALRREKPEVRAIVSYADPLERTTAEGLLTKPAHRGQIYQATNAVFAGRAAPRWLWLTRAGAVLSERALSKIRLSECGANYAEAMLLAAGADRRHPFEEPAAWLRRVLRAPLFRRLRHPGNFVYLFGLDRASTRQIAKRHQGGLPYPARP